MSHAALGYSWLSRCRVGFGDTGKPGWVDIHNNSYLLFLNGEGKQRHVEVFEALKEIGSVGGKDEVTWHIIPIRH